MRIRLFLSFALVILISVATVVIVARQSAANEVRTYMMGSGMAGLSSIAGDLEAYYQSHGSWQGAGSLLDTPGRGQGQGMGMGMGAMMRQRMRLADANGNVMVDTSAPQGAGGRLTPDELDRALPLQVNQATVGYLLPEGGMALGRTQETLLISRLTRAALWAGALAGGIALLLALLLSGSLLRPVQALTHAAARLGQGDLSQRVAASGEGELADLGRSFNKMADSLQQAEASRQAMTADIAHELRNPLAVQRASLEAMQDGVYPLTVENLQPVLEQNRLLTRLVDDLRTLALAEAGQLPLECAPTDLPALAGRVLERFAAQAAGQQVTLRLEPPAAGLPPVNADPGRVEQILNNLLSNALRHTPAGGEVTLALTAQPGTDHQPAVQLTVSDSGPGIPPEALPFIFDRFYRADRSRSRESGGSGLGLAIARQLAEAQGGTLTAGNRLEGGAVFTLNLPARA